MILKKIINSTSSKNYTIALKRRRLLFLTMIAVGIALEVIALFILNEQSQRASFIKGMGVGLLSVGIIFYVKNNLMMQNKQKMEKNKREEYDERNQEINNRALAAAASILMFLLAVSTIVTAFFNLTYSILLAMISCVFLIIYLICHIVYQKKM
ncbi:DUF6442 family protein [Enterococcus sp. CWB-B31]|uniref:DUF6442 family protein n=1 Tax=Enterococcus sp. CWB-B31 TaxID=2885159 RepID=UPI001E490DC6|nr:hypothetical protein [Enterococcus sp. CWB-B31]MCB5955862.1 hypothetical protein [Enterococcus sp. CWB-B31]